MRQYITLFITCNLIFFFTGCLKNKLSQTYSYTIYTPVYRTTAEVRANIKSNPPKEIQNPGKIYIYGNYIFLNEIDKGIHIIDNSNPASPVNTAFIDIPGNLDMAVKGNILFADLYTDLVTIDITNPLDAAVKKYNEGVFPFRTYTNGFYPDTTKVITDWIKRDTTITVDYGDNWWEKNRNSIYLASATASQGNNVSNSSSPVGMGGSMAKFAIVNSRMYTVSTNSLNIFNISSPSNPVFSNKVNLGSDIETIYPFKTNLFIGSQSGMFVYNINNPDNPVMSGQFTHARSCDPVIADNNYAYVTLHSGSSCQGFNNQLDIVQLNNITNSVLAKTYSLTSPQGLSKDGNLLFICDGKSGLKIYDASNVMNLQSMKQINDIETYDVIAWNNVALVVAKDGLYQFDYSNVNNIHLLSKISITK